MSNLNLDGFVTPEQNFAGLYNISNKLQENKKNAQLEQQKNDANKASLTTFLRDYADPKAHLSGSPTDPLVTQGFGKVLSKGMDLVSNNKGLTNDMLFIALSPEISRLATYASKAKVIKGQIDEGLKNINENSGYIKNKLSEEARRSAFYNEDGSLKEDFNEIDDSKNWIAEAVKNKPDIVTNDKGIDEWMKDSKMMVDDIDITEIGSRQEKKRTKVKSTAYPFAVTDIDEKTGAHTRKFVPLYDKAIDGDEVIMGDFDDGKGGTIKSQVRLLDNDLYTSMLKRDDIADYVKGQVVKYIRDGKHTDSDGNALTLNSPQANNLGRMILYDELKRRGLGSMQNVEEKKDIVIKQFAPRSGGGGGGSKKSEDEIASQNDLFRTLDDIKPNDKGKLNVSNLLGGVQILDKLGIKIFLKESMFDPIKKTFTITTSNGVEEMPYHKLATLIKTANPLVDQKWFSNFNKYVRGNNADNTEQPPQETNPKPKGVVSKILEFGKSLTKKNKETKQEWLMISNSTNTLIPWHTRNKSHMYIS